MSMHTIRLRNLKHKIDDALTYAVSTLDRMKKEMRERKGTMTLHQVEELDNTIEVFDIACSELMSQAQFVKRDILIDPDSDQHPCKRGCC